MGGFQAVASSLGGLGTDIASARLQDRADRMAEASLSQKWLMDKLANDFRERELANSQRWQEAQNWRVAGKPTLNPKTGKWEQSYFNPLTNATRSTALPGAPEDSFESHLADMKQLQGLVDADGNRLLSDEEAAAAAFRLPSLGKERPLNELKQMIDNAFVMARDPRMAGIIGKDPAKFALQQWQAKYGGYGFWRATNPTAWQKSPSGSASDKLKQLGQQQLAVQRALKLDTDYMNSDNQIRQLESVRSQWLGMGAAEQVAQMDTQLAPLYAKRNAAVLRAYRSVGIKPPAETGATAEASGGAADDATSWGMSRIQLGNALVDKLMTTLKQDEVAEVRVKGQTQVWRKSPDGKYLVRVR